MSAKIVEIENGSYVKFYKEDGHNKIEIVSSGRPIWWMESVDAKLGNYLFKKLKDSKATDVEWISYRFSFLLSAYFGDFDGFSDSYKDFYNCRPYITKEEWEEDCSNVRAEVDSMFK